MKHEWLKLDWNKINKMWKKELIELIPSFSREFFFKVKKLK